MLIEHLKASNIIAAYILGEEGPFRGQYHLPKTITDKS